MFIVLIIIIIYIKSQNEIKFNNCVQFNTHLQFFHKLFRKFFVNVKNTASGVGNKTLQYPLKFKHT